jgi:plasmid stabilization system protein ParE
VPRLIITEGAAQGLERCRQFIVEKGPQIAQRAAQAIERQLARLEEGPELGRPFPDLPVVVAVIVHYLQSGKASG